MGKSRKITITSKDGIRATAILPGNHQKNGHHHLLAQSETGQKFYIPFQMLNKEKGNHYLLPFDLSQLDSLQIGAENDDANFPQPVLVVPVISEEAEVLKRTVETGRVRLTKRVHEREEQVTQPLLREEVQVERIPINQYIDTPAEIRQEDNATIIPVMEEVLVLEKRILLKEEVRVTRRQKMEENTQTVNLREEEVLVERSH